MAKRVAIIQPNYIPWKGYFDMIANVDEFVLLDDVQYTRRDWRNRNRIKTGTGVIWLTIPVIAHGNYNARIRDVEIAASTWAARHFETISRHYASAASADEMTPLVQSWYTLAAGIQRLADVDELFIREVCRFLGIETPIRCSSDLHPRDGRNERLIDICTKISATTYVSGPSARAYLDERMFAAAGIAIEFADYSDYPEYPQLYPPFDHAVSIIDLLMNTGADAPKFMKSVRRCVTSTT